MKTLIDSKKHESKEVILHSKAVPMCSNRFDRLCIDSTFLRFYELIRSYRLMTQTAEKRTSGTNVGMKDLAFYFSSLGPVKNIFYFHIENKSDRKCTSISAFIFILKTSQDKVKKRTN